MFIELWFIATKPSPQLPDICFLQSLYFLQATFLGAVCVCMPPACVLTHTSVHVIFFCFCFEAKLFFLDSYLLVLMFHDGS